MSKSHTIPTGTMANAFAAAQVAAVSNYNYFDPIDFLDDTIKSPALKERVLSYMAWKIDMVIINAARNLFWESYKDSNDDVAVDFEEFIVGFRGVVDQSSTFGSGSALTLVKLLSMRSIWHAYAAASSSYMNRDYKERDLAEMIVQDDKRVVTLDTSKIKIAAEEASYGDADMADQLFKRDVAVALKKEADRRETKLKLRPCVLATLDAARACHCESANFWELDLELQAQFARAAIAAIESAKKQLSTTASVTTHDFRDIIIDAREVGAQLAEVLEKKYSDTVDTQTNIDHARLSEYKARKAAIAGLVD